MTKTTSAIDTTVSHPARRRDVLALGLAVASQPLLSRTAALADDASSVLATYKAFVSAQNAGDLEAVRTLFTQTPPFLWVSDGMSIWGRDVAIARMSLFRASEVWRVTPDLDRAVPVMLDHRTAYLHLPLDLAIGARAKPDVLPFLVSMLCHRAEPTDPWGIAAPFTTTRKQA
ncbi:hypothetical protein [uncultured Alsobacter sp.]|uniref:hypothetical protein n=1 Tax=uncultured Alsobacter sp. TaxID=1748258 RepID=UPI0025E0BF57|nr:hypothetical protein [uncultured Alsobacter sp.]